MIANPDYLTTEGAPSVKILRLAGETGCELMVMGTHGRTGLARILLGNVAESVLSQVDCPVLVVKATPGLAVRTVVESRVGALP